MDCSNDSSGYEGSDDSPSWIARHCKKRGHEMLVPVPDDFFNDFNMYGISKLVANFDEAMALINDEEDADIDYQTQAEKVFSLVH
jgi:hypothetical protein